MQDLLYAEYTVVLRPSALLTTFSAFAVNDCRFAASVTHVRPPPPAKTCSSTSL